MADTEKPETEEMAAEEQAERQARWLAGLRQRFWELTHSS